MCFRWLEGKTKSETYFPPKHGDIPWQFNFEKLEQVQVWGPHFQVLKTSSCGDALKTRFLYTDFFLHSKLVLFANSQGSCLTLLITESGILSNKNHLQTWHYPATPLGNQQNGSPKNPQISIAHI